MRESPTPKAESCRRRSVRRCNSPPQRERQKTPRRDMGSRGESPREWREAGGRPWRARHTGTAPSRGLLCPESRVHHPREWKSPWTQEPSRTPEGRLTSERETKVFATDCQSGDV